MYMIYFIRIILPDINIKFGEEEKTPKECPSHPQELWKKIFGPKCNIKEIFVIHKNTKIKSLTIPIRLPKNGKIYLWSKLHSNGGTYYQHKKITHTPLILAIT
jgi:hypothetical protein